MSQTENIDIEFDGRKISARRGETVAAALVNAGILHLSTTPSGAQRGIYCGMGVCQECLVVIDGKPNQRACMAKIDKPVTVQRMSLAGTAPRSNTSAAPITIDDIEVVEPELLIIGAGPGGLSAAVAARKLGVEVTVLDERPVAGGQFYKQITVDSANAYPADNQHLEGARLIDQAVRLGVHIEPDTLIWGGFQSGDYVATNSKKTVCYKPKRTLIATGAYERGHIVPGWTLPGVMTTGAAQTLWRSARRLPAQKVIIAGNGPLNLQLATELTVGGAEVVVLAEAARTFRAGAFADALAMMRTSPDLVLTAADYLRQVKKAGVSTRNNAVLSRIEAVNGQLRAHFINATTRREDTFEVFAADAICLGYGFEPSNELLRALGCAHHYDPRRQELKTTLDEDGKTSIDGIYAIGDCTGLGGARAALSAGEIVGYRAATSLGYGLSTEDQLALSAARKTLARHRNFQDALWRVYAYPRINADLADADTIICRCEEVTVGRVLTEIENDCLSIGEIKRRTRLAMGRCQGRYCGPVLQHMIATYKGEIPNAYSGFAPRPPVKPIAIEDLMPGEKE